MPLAPSLENSPSTTRVRNQNKWQEYRAAVMAAVAFSGALSVWSKIEEVRKLGDAFTTRRQASAPSPGGVNLSELWDDSDAESAAEESGDPLSRTGRRQKTTALENDQATVGSSGCGEYMKLPSPRARPPSPRSKHLHSCVQEDKAKSDGCPQRRKTALGSR